VLSLKFPVTMATRGHLKIAKNHYLCWFFPSKLISKGCNFSMDWDRVKGFSALVTRYLIIDLGLFLASRKSKIFLAMRGTTAPFKPHNRRENFPWCIFWMGAPRISGHVFKQHFSNKNLKRTKSIGGLNNPMFHHLRQQRGWKRR
jgi:hypothetical protein